MAGLADITRGAGNFLRNYAAPIAVVGGAFVVGTYIDGDSTTGLGKLVTNFTDVLVKPQTIRGLAAALAAYTGFRKYDAVGSVLVAGGAFLATSAIEDLVGEHEALFHPATHAALSVPAGTTHIDPAGNPVAAGTAGALAVVTEKVSDFTWKGFGADALKAGITTILVYIAGIGSSYLRARRPAAAAGGAAGAAGAAGP